MFGNFRPKYDFRAWLWFVVNCSCFWLIFVILQRVVAEFCSRIFLTFCWFLIMFRLISHGFCQFLFDLVEFGSIAFHFRQLCADFCLFWPIVVWFRLFSAVIFKCQFRANLLPISFKFWLSYFFSTFCGKNVSSKKSHIFRFWVFQNYFGPLISFQVIHKWYLDPKMVKKLLT